VKEFLLLNLVRLRTSIELKPAAVESSIVLIIGLIGSLERV
jgi:hypothetical protein